MQAGFPARLYYFSATVQAVAFSFYTHRMKVKHAKELAREWVFLEAQKIDGCAATFAG